MPEYFSENSLPNFMIVGAMRSGTTYLHRLLIQHPQIYMPQEKELHYFSNCLIEQKAIDITSYKTYFRDRQSNQIALGEASPEYMFIDKIPQLLKQYLPNLKIIFVLRDPIARAYSHYWWAVKGYNIEPLPFSAAINREIDHLDLKRQLNWSYVQRGYYLQQIQRFLEYFPRENLHYIVSDTLTERPQEIVDGITQFLNIDLFRIQQDRYTNHAIIPRFPALYRKLTHLNCFLNNNKAIRGIWRIKVLVKQLQRIYPRTTFHPKMPLLARRQLEEHFQPYNENLFKFLEHPSNLWDYEYRT